MKRNRLRGDNYDRWGNRLINNNGSATWGDGINNVVATIDTSNNRMLQ
jgi:hypothetical protein